MSSIGSSLDAEAIQKYREGKLSEVDDTVKLRDGGFLRIHYISPDLEIAVG